MNANPSNSNFTTPILIVENTDTTLFRLSEAVRIAGISNRLIILPDIASAVLYLDENGAYSNRDKHLLPGLVLLDVTLPKLSAFEIATWLTPPPVCRQIVVADIGEISNHRQFQSGIGFGSAVICKLPSSDSLVSLFEELRCHWIKEEKLSGEWLALHAA